MPVRFKLDENLPRDAVALLRDAGHDVQTVLEERFGGSADPKVFDVCRTFQRRPWKSDLTFRDRRHANPDPAFA